MQRGKDIAVVFKLAKEAIYFLAIKDVTTNFRRNIIPDFIGRFQTQITVFIGRRIEIKQGQP